MFGIAVKKDGRYHLISAPSFVRKPQKAAGNQQRYQAGETKKGIQLYYGTSELDDCNVKQYFDNLTVSTICANGTVPYKYNGVTYYFNELAHLQSVARECSRRHIPLTVEILLDRNDWEIDLINPKARSSRAPFYSWNIYQKRPREKMEAIFCYLGKVFSQKDCYVSNWILGNEVNHPEDWNGAGEMSKEEYFETYAYAFRALYYGIKSQYAACNPMIDAFIIRAYDDHPVEVAMGLRMGIVGKESFQVFKYMDSPQSLQYTSRYLSVIGASSWPQIVPNYQEDRIWGMYRN